MNARDLSHESVPLIKTCPKCRYVRRPDEIEKPECCPACGLYFEKWVNRDSFVSTRARRQLELEAQKELPVWRMELNERLKGSVGEIDEIQWYGYIALLIFFAVWGIRISCMNYENGEMSGSFMHAILLPIHEAGHVLFRPLGEFMTILGGSLFQLLLPMIAAGTLLWQNYDPFGAALGLWWCAISLMDLAPYIYDAKNPQLVLLGGHTGEDGPHDWIYLLGTFNQVSRSPVYGAVAHKLGVFMMLGALYWAFVVLRRMGCAQDKI
jgi:hypothetical protein